MRDEPTAADVIDEARSWLNVRWRHQGRSRAGIDCAGLVVLVGRALGLADHDDLSYARNAQGQDFLAPFRRAMDAVLTPDAMPGDVIVFADILYPCHCGILSTRHDVRHLIHSHASRRKVIEEPYTGEWPAKAKFAFRYRGLRTWPR